MSATAIKILNSSDKRFARALAIGTGYPTATTEALVDDTVNYPLHSEYWDATNRRLYRRIAVAGAVADWAYVGGVKNSAAIAFNTTIAIPNATTAYFEESHVQLGAMTGNVALSVLVDATKQRVGDRLFIYASASAADRTITYGAGFGTSAATLVVTSGKETVLAFYWNGTSWTQYSANADTV